MTSARAWVATLALALFMAACGGETAATPSPNPQQSPSQSLTPSPSGQTFKINPEPGVTANGTIRVTPGPTSTTIELKIISLQAASSHVSHIHLGSCQQRVGNRADAEDLTQQVAMKAIPRLRQGAPASAIRGYLFATARSVLGAFWSTRLGLSEAELREDLALAVPTSPPSEEGVDTVQKILAQLSDNYRRVLELRFLHGYSLKEVAAEMNSTVGAIKVMQLRALRAAAKVRVPE